MNVEHKVKSIIEKVPLGMQKWVGVLWVFSTVKIRTIEQRCSTAVPLLFKGLESRVLLRALKSPHTNNDFGRLLIRAWRSLIGILTRGERYTEIMVIEVKERVGSFI